MNKKTNEWDRSALLKKNKIVFKRTIVADEGEKFVYIEMYGTRFGRRLRFKFHANGASKWARARHSVAI